MMIYAVALNFNLVDVLVLVIIVRGFYIGQKTGFMAELLRLIGIICATFIILHHYILFGNFLKDYLFIPERVHELVSFGVLTVVVILVLYLVREGWLIVFKVEAKSGANKWGGAILSLPTSFLVCGLLLLGMNLFNNGYINQHMKSSFARMILNKTSVSVYKACHAALVRPFFPDEPLNTKVFKLIEERE